MYTYERSEWGKPKEKPSVEQVGRFEHWEDWKKNLNFDIPAQWNKWWNITKWFLITSPTTLVGERQEERWEQYDGENSNTELFFTLQALNYRVDYILTAHIFYSEKHAVSMKVLKWPDNWF